MLARNIVVYCLIDVCICLVCLSEYTTGSLYSLDYRRHNCLLSKIIYAPIVLGKGVSLVYLRNCSWISNKANQRILNFLYLAIFSVLYLDLISQRKLVSS